MFWLHQEKKNFEDTTHPAINFLVEELRKIYLKTHGFELIDRVKLIQERNDQLMQELQPYFPEPIISAEMLDTANSYDDKVAVMRMIVSDDAGRASNVFKSMMKEDMN